MNTGKTFRVAKFVWAASFVLVARPLPASAHPGSLDFRQSVDVAGQSIEAEDRDELLRERNQDQQDRDQERRDREQEKRDREQEKRDAEQEKRDREQERRDRFEELYDDGREALDDEKYEKARDKFSELAKANGPQTDAALYWEAYADQRLGHRQAALAAIADLKKRFP